MNRTDRLYALVEELRATAPNPRSARHLATRYEVSTRTIERDILALQESGVPIYAETGRRGGYTLDRTTTLPPLNFTPTEMVAIAVSLARHPDTPFAAATRSALNKVLSAASQSQTEQATELLDRVRLIEKQKTTVPLIIQEAIAARHVLAVDYKDRENTITSREIEPVAFVGSPTQWYLLAWCRLRDNPRAFRLDRITNVKDTGEPAPHRSYADLKPDIPHHLIRRPNLIA